MKGGESAIYDEQLIKMIKSGNNQALRILIERYKHHVFKVTLSVVHNQQDAEDLAQETFIKMIDALSTYQSQGFKTLLENEKIKRVRNSIEQIPDKLRLVVHYYYLGGSVRKLLIQMEYQQYIPTD
ncbi:hypothetical protein JCM21714_384 [Gracilibacillus boraciitolerans JCM 21714]|uniref:RNA polymerase sigma-70 region 2 domain-containing protein n=1 Tax=Gracilibacillus boraciitolerans JCM 21714 TaxID=1298598 RepID=W4VDH5_9BACI|nr:sigma factor [Gracilibacillus boraciitolerans]GAE91435.1 hypothetical protein JCM21714_384 [Gracilibacillus boraciitolerans JCM 21714]